jgi:hypothetical protein
VFEFFCGATLMASFLCLEGVTPLNPLFQVDILTNLLNTSLITTAPYPTLPLAADDEFNYLDLQIASYQKKYPHYTIDEIFNQMGEDSENMEQLSSTSNEVIDVTKLSPKEIIFLANSVDDVNKFEALEHIRSTYISSAPNVKLYYPEPFIASASFIHNDIGFIHILQYQF